MNPQMTKTMTHSKPSLVTLSLLCLWLLCQQAFAYDHPDDALGNLLDEIKGYAPLDIEEIPITAQALELLDHVDHNSALDIMSQYLQVRKDCALTPDRLTQKKYDFLHFWAKNQAHGTLYFRDLDYINLAHYFHYQSIFHAFDRLQAAYKEALEASLQTPADH